RGCRTEASPGRWRQDFAYRRAHRGRVPRAARPHRGLAQHSHRRAIRKNPRAERIPAQDRDNRLTNRAALGERCDAALAGGFKEVSVLRGGMENWNKMDYPVERN